MGYPAAIFFLVALVAAVLGFGGMAPAAGMAKILFFVFLVLAALSRGQSRRAPI